jgi:TonB family protein
MESVRRAAGAWLGAVVLLGASCWLPAAHAAPECGPANECLDAIMDAASAGRLLDELALMNALQRRTSAVSPPPPASVGRSDVRGMMERLAFEPSSSTAWFALASASARQGQHARAVAALVLADTWAEDPAAVRRQYEGAVHASSMPGLSLDYATALDRISAIETRERDEDAALAALPLDAGPRIAAIDFNSCSRPSDPRTGERLQDTGTTQIGFLVDGDGTVRRVRKLKSSGHVELDNAAFLALSACKFRHAPPRDGKLLAGWVRVQYVWTAP